MGDSLAIHQVDVKRALRSLRRSKAPGPDGHVAEIYRNHWCMLTPLVCLFNVVLETGRFPPKVLKLPIVPLDKPQRNRDFCESGRPVSPICVPSKILEAVVFRSMRQQLEVELDGRQYA